MAKLRLVLSPEARKDLTGIRAYTTVTWGRPQSMKYRRLLGRAFSSLQNQPHLGRPRDDLRAGLHLFIVEKHVIVYRIKGVELYITRILHTSMDIVNHL